MRRALIVSRCTAGSMRLSITTISLGQAIRPTPCVVHRILIFESAGLCACVAWLFGYVCRLCSRGVSGMDLLLIHFGFG